jgi:hypothetical protein
MSQDADRYLIYLLSTFLSWHTLRGSKPERNLACRCSEDSFDRLEGLRKPSGPEKVPT